MLTNRSKQQSGGAWGLLMRPFALSIFAVTGNLLVLGCINTRPFTTIDAVYPSLKEASKSFAGPLLSDCIPDRSEDFRLCSDIDTGYTWVRFSVPASIQLEGAFGAEGEPPVRYINPHRGWWDDDFVASAVRTSSSDIHHCRGPDAFLVVAPESHFGYYWVPPPR